MRWFVVCALFATPALAVTGDLNLDGRVDFDDFFIFADNFGREGAPIPCGESDPDLAPGGTPALLTDLRMQKEGSAYVLRFALKDSQRRASGRPTQKDLIAAMKKM